MFDYICTTCGAPFEESRNDYHVYYGCPYCGGDCERAFPCDECGELIPDSKYQYHLCDKHKKEALRKFLKFREKLSPLEIHYLEDKTDGMYWEDIGGELNGDISESRKCSSNGTESA